MQQNDRASLDQPDNRRMNRLLAVGLCAGYFLVLLDVTVVNVALPRLDTDLHAGAGLAWTVDAYTVPLAALLLAAGAVGDRVGHRRMVLAGFVGFGVASIVCALSPAIGVLIAGRALQGTAAALMLPGTLALLSQAAPDEVARNRAIGLWAAVGGAALPAGPVFGGVLVQVGGWRAVFWLGVPVIVGAVVAVLTSTTGSTTRPCEAGRRRTGDLAKHPSEAHNRCCRLRIDWPGAILLAMSLGSAVTAIIQGPGNTMLGGAMAATAACAGAALWLVEGRTPQPLLHVAATARRPLALACCVAAVMNLCAQGALFVLTQVFQAVHGLSPLVAGIVMLPAMLPLPLLGTISGRLTNKVGPWQTSAFGLLVAAAGFAGLAFSLSVGNGSMNYPMLLCSLAIWGGGVGILTPGIVTAAMRAVPDSPGTASGASNTSRQAGGAIGVALFGAIAGAPAGAMFGHHVGGLMWAGAVAFLLASCTCALAARSLRHGQG